MAKNKIQPHKQPPVQLEKVLEQGGRMLVIQSNKLSVDKLETNERKRKELEDELDDTRRSYRYYEDLFSSKEKMEAFLQVIIDKGNRIKEQLQNLPEFKTIGQRIKEDHEWTIENIMYMLAFLNEQLNITEGLNVAQIDLLATDIATTYPKLRLEDILLCFKRAIKGDYGKIYNRLDAAIIHEWITAYERFIDQQRAEHQERIHISSK